MNILIDGYNLLKQALGKDIIDIGERKRFLNLAQAYAKSKKHVLYIIYDGGPSARLTSEKQGNVIIVYSGWRQTADDVIKSYIDDKIVKNLLLVTTDRQLNSYASRAGIVSIDSLDFYSLMRKLKEPLVGLKRVEGKPVKLTEESSPELDKLMEEGESVVYYKEEEVRDEAEKGSKRERRLRSIVKKL